MSKIKIELPCPAETSAAVSVYCLTSLVVEEARRMGCSDFANAIEENLTGLLGSLPRAERREALRLSYELALEGLDPAPPRLRLVYSRD